MGRRREQDPQGSLLPEIDAALAAESSGLNSTGTNGQLYQGVNKMIASRRSAHPELFAGKTDNHLMEGFVAQARSLAASIDRVSGAGGGRQASGIQLAQMHNVLAEILDRLNPATVDADDPATEFFRSLLDEPAAPQADDRTP